MYASPDGPPVDDNDYGWPPIIHDTAGGRSCSGGMYQMNPNSPKTTPVETGLQKRVTKVIDLDLATSRLTESSNSFAETSTRIAPYGACPMHDCHSRRETHVSLDTTDYETYPELFLDRMAASKIVLTGPK